MRKLLTSLTAILLATACSPAAPDDMDAGSGSLTYTQILTEAEKGNADAEFELGTMFHTGDGIEKDVDAAFEWYEKAAKNGNRQAQFNLGMMYKNGESVSQNIASARGWFIRASDAGDPRAALQLGTMAYTGEGTDKDFEKALAYFLRGAKADLPEAQMNAGVMYIRGEGINDQNVIDGYAWLSLAKKNGNDRAASMLDTLTKQLTEAQIQEAKLRADELSEEIKSMELPSGPVT